jgi:hypothetical protein
MPHYEHALVLNPDDARAHNGVGLALTFEGKVDDAIQHFDRAIAISPEYAAPHYNRAQLKTFRPDETDLATLIALAGADTTTARDRPYLHFALAKALDDCGDYARAFEHLRKGNTLKRQQIAYNESGVRGLFERIATAFDATLFDRFQGEGDLSSTPVFVLGMPRSGSTLVEQILASHPNIYGAGELDVLRSVAKDPSFVPTLDAVILQQLGRYYLAHLPPLPKGKVRIIDKTPDNFLRIGLIRLILPNAKIIHTMRDPIDTCVSCYSQLFTCGHSFSYDLGELGRYYRGYSELMTHWKCVLPPGTILDVSYESVVDDLVGQARRMIEYCGLPWSDECINFYSTKRPIQTASAVQVRKPLFRTSLQRWRKYEAELAPLIDELDAMISQGAPTAQALLGQDSTQVVVGRTC